MPSEPKSRLHWKKVWKRALRKGFCPIAGCSLDKKTCPHLDLFLERSDSTTWSEGEVPTIYTEDVDDFSFGNEPEPQNEGAWALYKKLKPYKLPRGFTEFAGMQFLSKDQLLILLYKFAFNYSDAQTGKTLGYTVRMVFERRKRALEVLKKRGVV